MFVEDDLVLVVVVGELALDVDDEVDEEFELELEGGKTKDPFVKLDQAPRKAVPILSFRMDCIPSADWPS